MEHEFEIERQREAWERVKEIQEAEERLLRAQEATQEAIRAPERETSDAVALREEARLLGPRELRPEVEAEARLLRAQEPSGATIERAPEKRPPTPERQEIHKSPEVVAEKRPGGPHRPSWAEVPDKISLISQPREIVQPRVLDAIQQGIEEGEQRGTYIAMQGRAGELVAVLSGNRLDLNQLDLPMKGGNFPVYDNIGDHSVASVKVRGLNEAELSEQTKRRYLKDFQTAIGEGTDPHKFDKAADLLLKAKDGQLFSAPEDMKEVATQEEMKAYLRHHAELQIPANHTMEVQDAMRADIREFPENYGLDVKVITADEVEQLVQRVKPLYATTDVIRDMIDAHKSIRRAARA